MAGAPFDVSLLPSAQRALRAAYLRSCEEGRKSQFTSAAHSIHHRLRTAPRGFGEPYFRYAAAKLTVRIAIILPLAVFFAVHESDAAVFVHDFRLLSPPITET